MSGDYSRISLDKTNGFGSPNGSTPSSPATATKAPHSSGSTTAPLPIRSDTALPEQVDKVINSDIGIATLLNRLKQSIASARDFATFLKRRSTLEEEQATGLKKLAKAQMEGLRSSEKRGGSYAAQMAEVMRVHERMADNGMQFALSLHQMHEDLNELSTNMERGRKQWKHEGLDAEKRASDAESAMHKAKARYDGLAEDYDRARTGDTKGSRRIGLKGPKSAEQYEQDLLRKVQMADTDYEERVRSAKTQRESLLSRDRPKAVKSLQELIRECDSALTLQLQKFATFNEKLLLGNGLAVTPLTDKEDASAKRSLRDVVYEIDNDTDFHSFMRGHVNKIPARPSEIRYEQHPTLMPKTQKPTQQPSLSLATGAGAAAATGAIVGAAAGAASQQGSTSSAKFANQPPQVASTPSAYGGPQSAGGYMSSQGPPQLQSPVSYSQPPPQQQQPLYNSSGAGSYGGNNNSAAPSYPTYPSDNNRSASGPSPYAPGQTTGTIPGPGPGAGPSPQQRSMSNQLPSGAPMSPASHQPHNNQPPSRPVFGVSLDELFQRDQSAVPGVVIQCILAVDTYGLDVEGIYRLSGTSSHITTLKNLFNNSPAPPNNPDARTDFRNPANFFHDVNSVATLLKLFFRELPDPLFTHAQYSQFIEAARIEDEVARRDALHQGINDLPDPNYATLRALVLHLSRVMGCEGRNRMGGGNLAVCFAPSLMGTHTGSQIADASLQARVLDTILQNATAIFDED